MEPGTRRGRVVILGPVENEIGSGMTGGELVVYDPKNEVPGKLHTRSVAVIDCHYVDYEWLHPLIIQYHQRTGSRQELNLFPNIEGARFFARRRYRGTDRTIYELRKEDLAKTAEGREFLERVNR